MAGTYGGGALSGLVAKQGGTTGQMGSIGSMFGGAIGTALGGPVGGSIGSMVLGPVFEALFGKKDKQAEDIHDDIHAIRTNTDQMANMTAGLYNMPSTFHLPASVGQAYGDINITINANGDTDSIEDAVYRGLRRGLSRG